MSISSRNPAKDQVAIASAATSGFTAANTDRSQLSYAVQTCVAALRAAGLSAGDVDGIIGSASPTAPELQQALGIPAVTYFANPPIPIVNQLAAAVAAVHSGLCNVALVYHASYRLPWNTGSAWKDPLRRGGMAGGASAGIPESVFGSVGYTAWASRYLYEFRGTREDLGLVAINDRSNAARNPGAAIREPLTMEGYLCARMIRDPLCMLDMDIAVDGADAFVVTTTERARDMPLPPVLINAATLGMTGKPSETQTPSLREHGQQVVVESLKARGDFWIDDCDVYFPYDGFSIITLNWFENAGYCGPGEAGDFLRQHWDHATNRVLINGRVPVNPHGGSLSEGASQGSGHLREAVHQLQGLAGERQVPGARRAIVTAGGFFFNAQGATLRTDD
jgi:acetyl-CoA acetyltransferase